MVLLITASLLSNSVYFAEVKLANESEMTQEYSTYRFDFGSESSPVEEGYKQVANTLIYNEEIGYGFNKEVGFRDRGAPDNLRRDFALADGAEFMVDLPNGDYFLRIIAGDEIAFNRTSFVIEGEDKGNITSNSSEYSTLTTSVTITDGQLNIEIEENGIINGLEIMPLTEINNLRLDELSLIPQTYVKLTWGQAETAVSYNVYRKT